MATFKARARAVDMLGRQQIAGVANAISELFKNAHDAYADEASVDFYRSDRLFVLRDDGIGMTEEDFEHRWLTLGTESKAEVRGELPPLPVRAGYRTRAVLGEKGIGRLAIAAIGPQVLMMSRPLRGQSLGDLLVSFVHWGLFELPSANLADIEVPTVTLPGGTLPGQSDVETLVGWVEENLTTVARPADQLLADRIRGELKIFRTLAPDGLAPALGAPSLLDGPGTHFYILPATPLLADELDAKPVTTAKAAARPLRRLLAGFANTMTPDHAPPALQTRFRDHYTEDAFEDVIDEANFFTPAEFAAADHHIRGRFDEYGQFEGTVAVYGGEPQPYTVAWTRARGTETRCGPFDFNLAYVQGDRRESRLDPDAFREISEKLSMYGGLYLYRDGIRVLPYGNTDFDFLDIEVQRAKSASDAFFSYRRMFGVIELTRERNANLREKAGREGFADNDAYRVFRDILKNFLGQVAVDFFRDKGIHADRWVTQKAELDRLDKARARRAKQVTAKRKEFAQGIDSFLAAVDQRAPEQAVEAVVSRLQGQIRTAMAHGSDTEATEALVKAENAALGDLDRITKEYDVVKPRGVGLTRSLSSAWLACANERARLTETVFLPARKHVAAEIARSFETAGITADRRLRFDGAIQGASNRARDAVRAARRDADRTVIAARDQAVELSRRLVAEIEGLIQDVLSRAARLDVAGIDDAQFAAARDEFERELADAAATSEAALLSIKTQFEAIIRSDADGAPLIDLQEEVEALETDLEALKAQSDRDLEFAQLGAAVEIINHEFASTIDQVRRSIKRIESWSEANPALREPYRDLRASFEHLDGYLRLFTPLHRRLYRTAVEISGAEIAKYLRDVFERRLESIEARLDVRDSFARTRVTQHPSVLYPVFVNLVDNALHWLADHRGERVITLDADNGNLVVRDSGPGVSLRDRDQIFDVGFSRKPGGSGYGLFVSRQVLEREGWSITLAPASADRGAEFLLRPPTGGESSK